MGSSPLHHACREGDLQGVLDLLGGCDAEQVNAREGEDGPSPLDIASRHGHVDIMKALLKGRADVNLENSKGTALHAAVAGKQCAAINVLVDAGGNMHATSVPRCYHPIHLACEIGSVEVLETLLKHGADIEKTAICPRNRPMNVAAKHGHTDVVVALLAAGSPADHGLEEYFERTPLQNAASGGHASVVKTLLANGADVNFQGADCYTALHLSAGENYADVVDVLMEAGADPEMVAGMDSETPLHLAVVGLAHESAFALLRHGADVNAMNDFGDAPLHIAARYTGEHAQEGSYHMLEILLRFGADEHAVNAAGNTALKVALNTIDFNMDFDTGELVYEPNDNVALLRGSPADRRWRRRGMVVLGRALQRKLRIGDAAEEGEGAAGGDDAACLPATRETGGGTVGNTALEGRDGDGDSETVSAVANFGALMSSLLAMNEDDVFRRIVMFL